ncbi:YdiK family protein [Bacillaceae bacterium W0354]
MRISPLFLAIVYFLMGCGFIYIAVLSKTDTIWHLPTIIFTIVATLNIGVSIRLFNAHMKLNKNNKG